MILPVHNWCWYLLFALENLLSSSLFEYILMFASSFQIDIKWNSIQVEIIYTFIRIYQNLPAQECRYVTNFVYGQ